jgi:hypothetical protein
MLIRSQDKRSIAPIEIDGVLIEQFIEKDGHLYDMKHNDTTNGTSVYWVTGAGKWLGKYSTEAKAINVLDMIQDFYICCQSVLMVNGKVNKNLKDAVMSKIGNIELFVFQMPSDEEVED